MVRKWVVYVSDSEGTVRRKMHVLAEDEAEASQWGRDWLDQLDAFVSSYHESFSRTGWAVETWPLESEEL